MFNDHLSDEAARERIQRRMEEVETYTWQKRLGYGDHGSTKSLFVVIILTIALAALMLL